MEEAAPPNDQPRAAGCARAGCLNKPLCNDHRVHPINRIALDRVSNAMLRRVKEKHWGWGQGWGTQDNGTEMLGKVHDVFNCN